MPDETPITEVGAHLMKQSRHGNSGAGRVHAIAEKFHGYLEQNGGLDHWKEKAPSTDLGEAYHPDLEAAVFTELNTQPPTGWKPWNFACTVLAEQPSMLVKVVRGVKDGPGGDASCLAPKEPKVKKATKAKKEQEVRDVRTMFDRKLAALRLDPTPVHKAWMTKYTLQLVESKEQLITWVKRIQSDFSLWRPTPSGVTMPIIAVDTETFGTQSTTGLDTRLVNGRPQIDIAGICLCGDGRVSLYVPLNHDVGINLNRADVRRILQPLFDTSYLVFFNSKFDREVMRITCGISFRDFPFFEDVQNDNFLLDPKADLDEEVSDMGGNGLKDLAERELGIDQIELSTLCEVRAQYLNVKLGKKTNRNFMAPFSWVPTDLAVLYAAGDSLTTWLLWDKKHERSQAMKFPFKIDHMLVDTLTWIERQRFKVNVAMWRETVALHQRKMTQFRKQLCDMAGSDDFNPASAPQLQDVLFNKLGFKKSKVSAKTGVASTDKTVLEDLKKEHPSHPFLIALSRYRSYASLHPANLEFDPRDNSARMFFKQCTVAGGRLAAMGGGKKEGRSGGKDDGGLGLNPQAIKGVKGLHMVEGRAIQFPGGMTGKLAEVFDQHWVSEIPVEQLHESILKRSDGGKVKVEAPDVVNGIAHYMGQWWSFRPEDTLHCKISKEAQEANSFAAEYDLPVDPLRQLVDSNEVVNLRGLFMAPEGYTLCVVDYSNVEMRVAANVTKEPKFIDEFLTGSGDFHTLTAKAVFPEFSTTKDKVLRKELRALAKIINFALLYGGTEHAIYENMRRQDPTITADRAKGMVDAYWDAVPMFAEWTYRMRETARKTLVCTTPDGRRIDFHSVLAAEGLHEPAPGDYKNVQNYWRLRRKVEEIEKSGRPEVAAPGRIQLDKMWNDEDLGIKNASEYKKMVGKFERVAVNAPLQGMAGDLMRRALGLLHRWAENSGVEGALLVHATVHDEVDFCVKNEYLPYILPRVTRIMKLRSLHKACKWPVPLECDCEYGTSWDVKQHLTGDDGHVTAAYTRVPGMENYIPLIFEETIEQQLQAAVVSKNLDVVKEACAYLRDTLHPRVADVVARIESSWENPVEAKRCFIAACQLHEYWLIDENEDEASDESLAHYMDRMGLQPFPGLGVHVLSTVNVEDLPPLDPAKDLEDIPEVGNEDLSFYEDDAVFSAPAKAVAGPAPCVMPVPTKAIETIAPSLQPSAPAQTAVAVLDEPEPEEPAGPAKRMVPMTLHGMQVLRELSPDEMKEMQQAMGCTGRQTLVVYYEGGPVTLRNTKWTSVPEKYLQMVESNE